MNGILIKNWMREQEIRPEELAVKLHVSFSTVQNILNGKTPSRMLLFSIAGLTGIPIEDLMSPKKPVEAKKTSVG